MYIYIYMYKRNFSTIEKEKQTNRDRHSFSNSRLVELSIDLYRTTDTRLAMNVYVAQF